MRRATALVAVGVALAAAGCGSTVQSVGSVSTIGSSQALGGAAPAAPGDAGLSAPGGNTAPSESLSSAAPGAATAAGASTTNGRGSGTATSPSASTGVSRSGSSAQQGFGVTPKAIYLGSTYYTDPGAGNAALGASTITTGDTKAEESAVVADINAHGGVAGRKLVVVWHAEQEITQQPRASIDQAACTDYTQDHHVFATTDVGYTSNFYACMMKAGSSIFTAGYFGDDRQTFETYPYYFDTETPTQDRVDAALVPALVRQHYFTGWNTARGQPGNSPVKLGILSLDVSDWTVPLNHVLLPALKAAGQTVAPKDVINLYNPTSESDDTIFLRDVQNATLQFRSDHVTHVILLDTGGQMLTFFGRDASSQHYYPRFGLTSASGAQAIYDGGLVTAQQLNGSSGLGFDPFIDLPVGQGDKYGTTSTKHCLDVMKKGAGETYSSANAADVALQTCDSLYFLAYAINHAGKLINRDTVRAAVEATGSRFIPAAAPAAFFGPGRHDGTETGFDMYWNSGCSCVKYAGAGFRIP